MLTPLFSIIIPHKNCPHLLQRCIASIPKRNDLEVIIVDDNSDSDIVDFEHFPWLGKNNINVIFTKEGKGAGFARNVGMKHASGKWLLFADADDYYTSEFNKLLDFLQTEDNIDIVYFNANSEKSQTRILDDAMSKYSDGDVDVINTIKYNCWTPWNKVFLHSYIASLNLQWEEIPFANDAKFVLLAGYYTEKIDVVNLKCYTYTVQPLGITYKKRAFDVEYYMIPHTMNIVNFLRFVQMPWMKYLRSIYGPKRLIRLIKQYGVLKTVRYCIKGFYFFLKKETFVFKT